jgi:hypothetical protein
MLSQSANDLSISLLVHAEHADDLLKTLHHELIGDDSTGRLDVVSHKQ